MTFTLAIAFFQTLLLSLILTPFTKQLAGKIGAVDIPNNRKVHKQPTPRLGGLGILISIIITLGMYYFLFPHLFNYIVSDSPQSLMNLNQALLIAGALLLVFFLGVWDDIKTLKPAPKFAVQFLAATLIYFAGFEIDIAIGNLTIGAFNLNSVISYIITLVWIVGITNAFNLIDGLDGLASGVAVIALSTIAMISLIHGQIGIGLASLLISGAIMGFLWYNFRPATIFLGDSGSLLLGFALALLSIESFTKTSTAFAIFVPLFALGLPIIDTLLSMIRRFFSWFMPGNSGNTKNFSITKALKSLFQPDKSHIHHQLISRGLSHKNTVLVLYVVSILFGLGALTVSMTEKFNTVIWVILISAAVIKVGVSQLDYKEIDLFHNGIFLTVYNALVINKRHFRKVLDGLFILSAFTGSYYLLFPDTIQMLLENRYKAALILGTVYFSQSSILWLSGIYKETIRSLGIADVIAIVKSVAIAVLVSALIHYFFFRGAFSFNYSAYILNFYFLGTLILGIRVSFHILKYLFYKSRQNNRRVLIYGAGEQGLLALQRLMNFDSNQYTPVGFLDDDPALENRIINGFSVFGGHWKLEQLTRNKRIDEVLITEPNLQPEVMNRIRQIAQEYGLDVRLMQTELRDLNINSTSNEHNAESFKYAN